MFWFDKQNEDVIYMDNRELDTEMFDGRKLVVSPDVIADFRDMPFADESFNLVVFDPPHLLNAGETSWLRQKYGILNKDTWKDDLTQGFAECFRVLKPNGTLIFKWNTEQINLAKVLKLTNHEPLFGDKRSKTRWIIFMK